MGIKRVVLALAVAGAVAVGATGMAGADSPHFVKASAASDGSGNLVVSWKEAGLGNNQNVNYVASANATSLYGCVNHGGKHPQASNKESFSGPVTASGTFSSGKNGSITASLTLTPPGGQAALDCPDDMAVTLLQVTYTNVAISDTTNNVSQPIGGSFSYSVSGIKF